MTETGLRLVCAQMAVKDAVPERTTAVKNGHEPVCGIQRVSQRVQNSHNLGQL